MPPLVPEFPPDVDMLDSDGDGNFVEGYDQNQLRVATPVMGDEQWRRWNDGVLWVLGRGGTLCMQGPLGNVNATAPGSTTVFRSYIWPHYQAVARMWCVTLGPPTACLQANWDAYGTFILPSGAVHRWKISPTDFGRRTSFTFFEVVASPTAVPGGISVTLTCDSSSLTPVWVGGWTCYELRRRALDDFGPATSSLGAFRAPVCPPETLQTGAPIMAGDDTNRNLGGLFRIINDPTMLLREVRRPCLFGDYRPAGINWISTSYTLLYIDVIPVLVAPRSFGDAQRQIAVAVYGRGPAGSNVRFTADTGDSVTLALPTSNGYVTGVLEVDVEQGDRYGIDGGIRGGVRDSVIVEAQRVGGSAGDCVVYGTWMGEAS